MLKKLNTKLPKSEIRNQNAPLLFKIPNKKSYKIENRKSKIESRKYY